MVGGYFPLNLVGFLEVLLPRIWVIVGLNLTKIIGLGGIDCGPRNLGEIFKPPREFNWGKGRLDSFGWPNFKGLI